MRERAGTARAGLAQERAQERVRVRERDCAEA